MKRKFEEWEIVHILARVAAHSPMALPLAAQLLGVPPCPKCGYVMRADHGFTGGIFPLVCRPAAAEDVSTSLLIVTPATPVGID